VYKGAENVKIRRYLKIDPFTITALFHTKYIRRKKTPYVEVMSVPPHVSVSNRTDYPQIRDGKLSLEIVGHFLF
jgi:hypothetical protein